MFSPKLVRKCYIIYKASLVPVLETLTVGIDGGKVEKVHKGQSWRAWVGLSSCLLHKSFVFKND